MSQKLPLLNYNVNNLSKYIDKLILRLTYIYNSCSNMTEKDFLRNIHPRQVPSTKDHPYRNLSEETDILVPRPSILLPTLQNTEKKFFELVAAGRPDGIPSIFIN